MTDHAPRTALRSRNDTAAINYLHKVKDLLKRYKDLGYTTIQEALDAVSYEIVKIEKEMHQGE